MMDRENDISHTLVQVMLFENIAPNSIFYNFEYTTILNTQTNGGESGGASTVEDWIIKAGLSPDELWQ